MKPSCLHAESLMQRRAVGLRSFEGLQLEEHLMHCAQCRHSASLLSGLRSLYTQQPSALPEAARRRAISAALAIAPTRSPARRRSLPLLLAAAAVIALVGMWSLRSERARAPRSSVAVVIPPVAQPSAAQDRVLSGVVETGTGARTTGQALAGELVFASAQGARVALAHATVELRPETRLRWDAARRALRLEAGSLLVEVDPARHQSFEVLTPGFSVQVLGTGFVVDAHSVTLLHGRVRVVPVGEAEPTVLDAEHPRYEQPEPPAPKPAPATHKPNVQALLDDARARLAGHDLPNARKLVQRARAAAATSAERAEAASLLAECSLVAGRFSEARSAFLQVADRYAPSPAAQAALFAAARIEAEHGDHARARSLFARYLARYPHGSLATQARKRSLALMEAPP